MTRTDWRQNIKKLILTFLLLSAVLFLVSCSEGLIDADINITSKNGAGTKTIILEILHDDAIASNGELVENNFSKHLPNGSEAIVDKLKEVSPLEDLQISLIKDRAARADYISLTYSFSSLEDYNKKTRTMAQEVGLDIKNAKITRGKYGEVIFTELSSNLQNSIEWALDAVYRDSDVYFSDGVKYSDFSRVDNYTITVGDNSETFKLGTEKQIKLSVAGLIKGYTDPDEETSEPDEDPDETLAPPELPTDIEEEVISVDFNSEIAPASSIGSGFIQAPLTGLFDEMITGINPTLYRYGWVGDGFEFYDRVRELTPDAIYQIVVSDMMYIPECAGMDWEQMTRYVVQKAKDKGMTKVQYDLFNEPTINPINFDLNTLCYWWDRCYRAAKEIDPDAVIVGPSFAGLNRDNLKAFLKHCSENDTVPDIVNWHFSNPMRRIPAHVQEMKDYAKELGIDDKIQGYMLNENILSEPWMSKSAGHVVQLFANAERAQVHTAHAVWNGDEQYSGLDGIIARNRTKTSQWWAYNTYVNMKGTIVNTVESSNYDAVASIYRNELIAKVLIGDKAKNHKNVKVILNNIPSYMIHANRKIKVRIDRIPYAEEKSKGPELVYEGVYTVSDDNSLEITNHMDPMDAYIVTLEHFKVKNKGATKLFRMLTKNLAD